MIYVGSDHAGYELKLGMIDALKAEYKFEDLGTNSKESCDYPDFAEKVAKKVLEDPSSLGLLFCGTGVGMAISANKISGIRAAVVSESYSARMAREHNKAQILCLGGRVVELDRAIECFRTFASSSFDLSNPRHQRRVDKISKLEEAHIGKL